MKEARPRSNHRIQAGLQAQGKEIKFLLTLRAAVLKEQTNAARRSPVNKTFPFQERTESCRQNTFPFPFQIGGRMFFL